MNRLKIGAALRFFFLASGALIWLGIALTGFGTAHWLLYVPAIFFIFAAVTGICPGVILSNRLFPGKANPGD
jgi:hypothetical protein